MCTFSLSESEYDKRCEILWQAVKFLKDPYAGWKRLSCFELLKPLYTPIVSNFLTKNNSFPFHCSCRHLRGWFDIQRMKIFETIQKTYSVIPICITSESTEMMLNCHIHHSALWDCFKSFSLQRVGNISNRYHLVSVWLAICHEKPSGIVKAKSKFAVRR